MAPSVKNRYYRNVKPSSSFSERLLSITERGLALVGISHLSRRYDPVSAISQLCQVLLSSKGEASGIALSLEILSRYQNLSDEEKTEFFVSLYENFPADQGQAEVAARAYLANPSQDSLWELLTAAEPARQELFRRLNQTEEATKILVNMRADFLSRLRSKPELRVVDRDFIDLFTAWFNRGFLELRRIDWNTPAALLEKIMIYEAVHGMSGWGDLRERIDPPDRLIYGFFHPQLGDEPLIFVEVALMEEMPASIDSILAEDRKVVESESSKIAVFYSISNCQRGLRGIPLGNFLIKQVVKDLKKSFPSLKEYVTLSPIPSFARWFADASGEGGTILSAKTRAALAELSESDWWKNKETSRQLEQELLPAAAWFLCHGKKADGRPIDPVARFHLGNGARLERINWSADTSDNGLRGAHGMMVNYRYRLDEIERNHEGFANSGLVAASSSVTRLANAFDVETDKNAVESETGKVDSDA
ncbi:MAG: malonyl-CoA decarboxylase [Desulfuromusa sp.]|nr:malonyl-CoA decarboxylase [Desulfuromusa sp.]